jgi:hypothetical protein
MVETPQNKLILVKFDIGEFYEKMQVFVYIREF